MNKNNLKKIIKNIFIQHGLNYKHAEISSNYIIQAELLGLPSHGLARLKMYCNRIKKKLINSKPKIKIKKISQSISHIDANNAIGFVSADVGIKVAIKSAKKTGFGLVGIKNSGHYGLSSFYAEQAVKENLMVWCFTNAPPAIAPHGSKKALFGTNPICFGTPTGKKIPFILDTSASMINRGKIRRAEQLCKTIPSGVALDKYGNPTTNPKKALKGVQLPIAGFKGSGLAWMVDIISGVLTGANHGGKVKDPFDDLTGPQNVGHLFIVIKPGVFVGKKYLSQIKKNINAVKRLPKSRKIKKILYPGENKYAKYKKNLKKDIEIPKNILKDINTLNAIK
ncbi:MAG: sulfolactate dehydrogenase [Candidatus Pelagibacter sp. TMED64]|nr:MAG: sulfolactate dehydrogenase [Candidatus Pelagibacter sp. TMED64]|tara:strand:+ start:1220 stop:2233 length:1014 start_codon:yes stop_codon:yes gene_type:complete